MNLIKNILDKALKVSLVIIILPALVFYATSFRSSISFFTNSTQSEPFHIVDEQPMLLMNYLQTEAYLEIIGNDEIEVSNDYIEQQYFAIVTDNGEEISNVWVYWSLAEEVPGVAINHETGVLTVQSYTSADVIVIQADVVGMTAYKAVRIVYPLVLFSVPESIYGNIPESVPASIYGEI